VNVSAVVVNYNARDHLVDCVRSLRAEGLVDVVVVDNASADGSEAALRAADADAHWHQTGANLGFGAGANRGAARTDAANPYLLVCNADVVLEPGALKAMVEAIEADPRRAVVGPRVEDTEGELYPSARTFPDLADAVGHAFLGFVAPRNRFTRRYRMLDWDHAEPAEVDWVSGSCFLARREAWQRVGGFDERYFMYAEDVDLCWRVRREGWTVVYEPAARVVHVQGASTALHPYWMILEHHKALLRFAARSTTGWRRGLLPLMAAALAVRVPLAWAHRLLVVRRPGDRGRLAGPRHR
jgi:N-acetylglucosaminyl-diphospho-decaprenol L-rhamnosyltransferase